MCAHPPSERWDGTYPASNGRERVDLRPSTWLAQSGSFARGRFLVHVEIIDSNRIHANGASDCAEDAENCVDMPLWHGLDDVRLKSKIEST